MNLQRMIAALLATAPLAASLRAHTGEGGASSPRSSSPSPEGYFYTKRGGDARTSNYVPYTAPSDFSRRPAWVWNNSLDEQVRHSPLIDDKKNVYVMTTLKLRKFSPDGELLWMEQWPQCRMTASPALYKGSILLLCPHVVDKAAYVSNQFDRVSNVTVIALSMDTGDLLWDKTVEASVGGDSPSLFVESGTLIIPMDHKVRAKDEEAKTSMWYAMNASNGDYLWQYAADEVVWNAVPATPGDGTLLFASSCGGASRIAFGGKLIWRAGAPSRGPDKMCSTGGGSVGPNGVFYTEYTRDDGSAHVSAYQISDGTVLWERNFGTAYGGGQYPAVGRLGAAGPLAVVVAIGGNPGLAPWMYYSFLKNASILKSYHENATIRKLLRAPEQLNAVVALDATSGDVLWRWEEDVWDHVEAAGDGDENSLKRAAENSPENAICLPDLQGIPLITADGTVYASSSHGGDLTAIRDTDGNGVIDPNEVSKLPTHMAFLNSPSAAPGMLVAAPCWGPMYVFKD